MEDRKLELYLGGIITEIERINKTLQTTNQILKEMLDEPEPEQTQTNTTTETITCGYCGTEQEEKEQEKCIYCNKSLDEEPEENPEEYEDENEYDEPNVITKVRPKEKRK